MTKKEGEGLMDEEQFNVIRQNKRQEAILNTTHAVIITIDKKGSVDIFNQAASLLFGYSTEEVKGRNIKMLMPEPFRGEHDQFLRNYLSTGVRKIINLERKVLGLKKDGTIFPMNLRVKEIDVGGVYEFVGFVEDLSERDGAKKALKQSEQLYLSVVEDQDNLICRYTPDFTLVFVNKAFCKSLNKNRDELIGCSLLDLNSKDVADWLINEHRNITIDSPVKTHESQTSDGSWEEWSTRGIFYEGTLIEYQGVGRDTTERKQSEIKILESYQIAENANKAKSQFLSNMSHELRTPLNSIIGFSELLVSDEIDVLTEDQLESVEYINKAGEHLLSLINDILDLSVIESGDFKLNLEVIDLLTICREASSFINPVAEKYGINVSFNLDFKDYYVYADHKIVKQIILNLLTNAIKYNKQDGTVEFYIEQHKNDYYLAVKDTGYGISRENIQGLFTPFNRLGLESSAIEGTGIGLSLCKNMVEKLNGKIGVESEVDIGSTFWFTLPISTDVQHSQLDELTEAPGYNVEIAPAKVIKILYIEDNKANMNLMRRVIKKLETGILLEATTADEGFSLIENREPDLILLDINLPDMNGFDAFVAIKKRFPSMEDVPIIALTASAMKEDYEKGISFGFFDYLTKPFNIENLITIINKALHKNEDTSC